MQTSMFEFLSNFISEAHWAVQILIVVATLAFLIAGIGLIWSLLYSPKSRKDAELRLQEDTDQLNRALVQFLSTDPEAKALDDKRKSLFQKLLAKDGELEKVSVRLDRVSEDLAAVRKRLRELSDSFKEHLDLSNKNKPFLERSSAKEKRLAEARAEWLNQNQSEQRKLQDELKVLQGKETELKTELKEVKAECYKLYQDSIDVFRKLQVLIENNFEATQPSQLVRLIDNSFISLTDESVYSQAFDRPMQPAVIEYGSNEVSWQDEKDRRTYLLFPSTIRAAVVAAILLLPLTVLMLIIPVTSSQAASVAIVTFVMLFVAGLLAVSTVILLDAAKEKYDLTLSPGNGAILLVAGLAVLVVSFVSIDYVGDRSTANEVQEQVVRVAYAQEQYRADNGGYTEDLEELTSYDQGIKTDEVDGKEPLTINLHDQPFEDDDEFFTITGYWTKNGDLNADRGFALQGNQNGVYGTCNASYGCDDSKWDYTAALPDSFSDRVFPMNPNGADAVDKPLSPAPGADRSCPVYENPYQASSPFADPPECSLFKEE